MLYLEILMGYKSGWFLPNSVSRSFILWTESSRLHSLKASTPSADVLTESSCRICTEQKGRERKKYIYVRIHICIFLSPCATIAKYILLLLARCMRRQNVDCQVIQCKPNCIMLYYTNVLYDHIHVSWLTERYKEQMLLVARCI